jgi:hypothetical protein
MKRTMRFAAAIGLCLLVCPLLGAGQKAAAFPAALVLVAIQAADAEAEAIRPVLEDAVAYRLKRQGLDTTFLHQKNQESESALIRRALAAHAAFSLLCSYAGSRSEMRIAMRWYDIENKSVAAAVDCKGRVDLRLDTLILRALDDLLVRVQDRIEAVLARQPARPAEIPSTEPSPVDPGFALQPPAGESPPAAPPADEANPLTPPAPDHGKAGIRFLLSPEIAPFIAVGAASYYFKVGAQATAALDFLIPTRSGHLGVGALVGVSFFSAQGTLDKALSFLVPLGADLRYGLSLGPRLSLMFHLAGGPALLVMSLASGDPLTKVLPFVASGIGLELGLSRVLYLGIDAGYGVYFETPYLIMGFTPALNLSWRV